MDGLSFARGVEIREADLGHVSGELIRPRSDQLSEREEVRIVGEELQIVAMDRRGAASRGDDHAVITFELLDDGPRHFPRGRDIARAEGGLPQQVCPAGTSTRQPAFLAARSKRMQRRDVADRPASDEEGRRAATRGSLAYLYFFISRIGLGEEERKLSAASSRFERRTSRSIEG